MNAQILTFTNLFPSSGRPRHGTFVQDRMQRVAAATGLDWQVVCPIPRPPFLLRRAADRELLRLPAFEEHGGARLHHTPYLHVPGISLVRQATRMARACLPVVRRLASDRPTVIDAHYVYPDGVAAMTIARALGLPCVVTARGTDVNVIAETPGVRRQLEVLCSADALLAVSAALRDRFAAILPEGAPAVQVVRNGVDLDVFSPGDRDDARRALGLPLEGRIVLGVGRLVASKGFHHAAAVLTELGADVVLALAGKGPDAERLQRMCPEGRLVLFGSLGRDALVAAYRACDVTVLPTYREGWPNVVTEALACGRPVVASDVGGIPEILQDDAVSRRVPPGDEPALRSALRHFLDRPADPVQARALAARYSWEEPVATLAALFSERLS